jgi:hypothetical protein
MGITLVFSFSLRLQKLEECFSSYIGRIYRLIKVKQLEVRKDANLIDGVLYGFESSSYYLDSFIIYLQHT